MAFIDWGAILRVNGKFINKNEELFMKCSDAGYVCEKATDKNGNMYDIDGNYFVYAGDKDFMLVFYKGYAHIISNEKIIYTVSWSPFIRETFYFDGHPNVTVELLDKELKKKCYIDPFDEEEIEDWINHLGKKKTDKLVFKRNKDIRTAWRKQTCLYVRKLHRWLATWTHNGNKYEVIFGRGIDPSEKCWNDIKFEYYDFSDVEREIIDNWFKGE